MGLGGRGGLPILRTTKKTSPSYLRTEALPSANALDETSILHTNAAFAT